ncbi:Uma2 family endonuclease [Ilyomonas limi]|uniref:Uma2 family endonuclease n=1 Tax=Ilyomonas limi TaxID=2575867 RepID=A0A4U3L8P8_9BACT|nr:Uma2 family endonuclease [Ilyomonas limi]TKK70889.1 Uma2 family endonuclease [Ilyomonas limi]
MVFTGLDWKISNETVVRPDVMIVCGKIETDYLEFPPALIVEILSSTSLVKNRNIKFELYRENGVKYYIMADYTKETVEVFELIDN